MANNSLKKAMTEKMESIRRNMKKSLAFNSKPSYDDFPELVTIIMWVRFVLGLGYGISMGRNLTYGSVGILFGLNAICLVPMAYCNLFLQADTDSYGAKLLFGGVHNACALMLLIWIYYYTVHFSEQEQQMIAMLIMKKMTSDGITTVSETVGGMIDPSTKDVFDENVVHASDAASTAASASAEAASQLQQEAAATGAMDESEF